ncbi:MAG: biopolymer transporter ExbD [Bacteroidia bacterium]|nr:biopolymer transporter ExbD [Bacteroidia bacterium]MDW8345865.1 biopolymer transporter ExbD [Bacteroidia bacterium]
MGKVKVPRKSTNIDMTAMCDVAFLLLTFFILTAKFKPNEPIIVDTPASVADKKLPEDKVITISVDKKGRVFFGVDNIQVRRKILDRVANEKKLTLSAEQRRKFENIASFGVPMNELPKFLTLDFSQHADPNVQKGIPIDTTNKYQRSELTEWIQYSRLAYKEVTGSAPFIAVKADYDVNYPAVQDIINTLQSPRVKINKFNLVTNLEKKPEK